MKVVVNTCYGGFGLSNKAILRYAELKGIKLYPFGISYLTNNKTWFPVELKDIKENHLHWSTTPIDKIKNNDADYFSPFNINRIDPALIQVVEELGEQANGMCADLEIRDIPDDVDWFIDDYDGIETIHEEHDSW